MKYVLLLMAILLTSCQSFTASNEPTPPLAVQFVSPTVPAATPPPTVINSPTASRPSPTSTPSATPSPTTTPTFTPTPNLTPQAIINSPGGSLNVRSGPGAIYNPPLGTYNNGAQVNLLGRQNDINGEVWWLIPFASNNGDKGWIYAKYTEASNTANLPWVTAPATPTPVVPPTVINTKPQAIMNNPAGFVQVKQGPGEEYDPPWGAYNNGVKVEILGKQYARNGELWWLIPFEISPTGQGWVNSRYTQASNTQTVPWINAPLPIATPVYGEQPTIQPIDTPTYGELPTPIVIVTPPAAGVDWTIAGRVVDARTGRALARVSVQASLGADEVTQAATTNSQGEFSISGVAADQGDLYLTLTAAGYQENSFNAGFSTGRAYYFNRLTLAPLPANIPLTSWTLNGRVSEVNTHRPIVNAQVQAILGSDALKLITMTNSTGEFTLSGQAHDAGALQITVTATGYQTSSFTPNPTTGRTYTLFDLELTPSTTDCLYDNVIGLPQDWAIARLQTLGFTEIRTQEISGERGQVINQIPQPPATPDQAVALGCDMPILLSVGQ